tara:strand:- start:2500 stop:3027 length:528 start_codon:yes stop_codon:yes gene_type:complete
MWLYNKTTEIKAGRGWKDADGNQQPPNWDIWDDAYKKSMNIEEIILDVRPDNRFHNWIDNGIGGVSNITDKPLDDVTTDGRTVTGIRSNYIQQVKIQQESLLSQTDWVVVRKADTGTDIPIKTATYRAAIRTKATEMENSIKGASNMAEFKNLFLSMDEKGNKKGSLFDWPKLEE